MKSQRFILILAIALGAVLAIQLFGPKEPEPPKTQVAETQPAPSTQPTTGATQTAGETQPAESVVSEAPWRIKPGTKEGCTLGSLDSQDEKEYRFQLTLRSEGASIESVHLTDYFQTVADKRLFDKVGKDQTKYARRAADNPKKYKGHYAVISPVVYQDMSYYSLATRKVVLVTGAKGQGVEWEFEELRDRRWQLVETPVDDNSQSAIFEWPIYRASDLSKPAVTLRKTYTVTKGSYSVGMTLECVNHTDTPIRLKLDQAGPTGVTQEDPRADQRMAIVARLTESGEIQRQDLTTKQLNEFDYGVPYSLGRSDAKTDPVVWLAYVNKFFGSVLYLKPQQESTYNAAATKAQFYIRPVQQTDKERTWQTGLWVNDIELTAAGQDGATKTFSYDLFAGPKIRSIFNNTPLYKELQYTETITTRGGCGWCTFTWLMEGLMWLLNFFADHLTFGNFGLAIILLVILVRILLHPLMKKSQISMAKMQKTMAALKPQMEKVREKYANDRQTQQRELLKLQKEAGMGPGQMLGCLPMLLQMPIWIALYTGLNSEVSLRHAAFLPVWITDLAAPDRLFSFGTEIPFVGEYFNLLPILLTVAMFLSMKMNPAAAAQSSSPEQKQQQMMMKLMMPVMMLLFFYNAPSGLTLYIMASTFAGVAESYYIRKHIKEREEIEASSETVVKVSGKGPRGSRPKKPKGPFWTKRG